MFLFERIVGVSAYLVILLVFCNGISVSNGNNAKRWLLSYAFVLALLGFFYVPYYTADLVRLTEYMNSWANMNVYELIDACANTTSPVYLAYFWLIGQFRVDGLLPAITAFLGYSLIFSCAWDYSRRCECGNKGLAYAIAFLMGTTLFMGLISGIRNSLANALVFYAWYGEFYKGSKFILSLPLYIVAALLHPAAVVLVALRFIFFLFQRESQVYKRLLNGVLGIALLMFFFAYGEGFTSVVTQKGLSYLDGDHYSYVWEQLISTIQVVVVLIATTFAYRGDGLNNSEKNTRLMLSFMLVALAIAFFANFTIFVRYSQFVLMWGLVPIMKVLGFELKQPMKSRRFNQVLIFATIVLLVLSCTRGSLCSYKFFELLG